MKKPDELKLSDALAMIIGGAFTLDMNANDLFAYACSHSVTIDSSNVKWMIPIIQKYGSSGLDACVAYVANMEPIDPWKNKDYILAIDAIKKLSPVISGDKDNSEFYDENGPYRKVKK